MRASGQRMTGGKDADQLILEQGKHGYARIVHVATANGQIESSIDDGVHRRKGQAAQDLDIELGPVGAKTGDEARQPSLAPVGAAADSDHGPIAFAKELEVGFYPVDFADDRLGGAQNLLAHGREVQAAIDPVEQRY